jgi:membrane fusion protein, heavy metal efflux system
MNKIIGLVLIAVTLYSSQIIEISQEQQHNLGIKTQEATQMRYIALTPYNGKITQNQKDKITISSNFEAIVDAIYVSRFSHVKKGEKLLTLKSNALLTLQRDYIESNIQNKTAKLNYERDIKLEKRGVISQKRVLESKSIYESTLITLKLSENQLLTNGFAKKSLENIKLTNRVLQSHNIYAPKSGVIDALDVNVGEFVEANKKLVEIYADAKRYIEISVPASVAENLSLGDLCEFSKYKAKIVAISNIVEEASQSVMVRAEIQNPQGTMINHIYEVKILKDVSDCVKISKSALVFVDGDAFVFKRVDKGFEVIDVEIVSEGPVCYVVQSELEAGDTLAASSTAALLGALEDQSE